MYLASIVQKRKLNEKKLISSKTIVIKMYLISNLIINLYLKSVKLMFNKSTKNMKFSQ